jgi:hypothetical protein
MTQKDKSWTRGEKISIISLLLAFTMALITIRTNKDIRCSIASDCDKPQPVTVIKTPNESKVPQNDKSEPVFPNSDKKSVQSQQISSPSSNPGMNESPALSSPSNRLNPTKEQSSKTYKNYENDFVIFKYPDNWHEINIVNMSKEFVTFVSNEPSERLSVAVDSLRKDLKLEKIDDFLEKEKSDIKSPTSQASFVAMTIKNINGRRFGEVVSTDRTKKNKIIKSFFIQKDKIYTVTYIQKDFDLPPVGINIVLESINPK